MRMCNPNFLRALWPAFLIALAATGVLFSAVDPQDVLLFGHPLVASREAIYTVGLFVLWLICWLASALNLWLFGCRRDTDEDEELAA